MLDGHLHAGSFGRIPDIEPGQDIIDPDTKPDTRIPFHILVQCTQIPFRRDPAYFSKTDKLKPRNVDSTAQNPAPSKWISGWDMAVFQTVINGRAVAKPALRKAFQPFNTAQPRPFVVRRSEKSPVAL